MKKKHRRLLLLALMWLSIIQVGWIVGRRMDSIAVGLFCAVSAALCGYVIGKDLN